MRAAGGGRGPAARGARTCRPACGSPAVALEHVRLPDAVAARRPARLGWTGSSSWTTARPASRTRSARATRTWCASARATGRARPTPWSGPRSTEEVAEVLGGLRRTPRWPWCRSAAARSVVGGVEPLRDGFAGAVSLDLSRIDRDPRRRPRLAHRQGRPRRVRPDPRGPAPGARADARATFPQSFEYSTAGGWVATRSAGQASTGYGRIDELVEGVRCIAPGGRAWPRARCPPRRPARRCASCWWARRACSACSATSRCGSGRCRRSGATRAGRSAPSSEGCEAFRRMEQEGAAPDVARLSDEEETRLSMALASSGSAAERAGRAYLRAARPRGRLHRDRRLRGRRRTRSSAGAGRRGAAPARGGRAGARRRGRGAPGCATASRRPYLRDELLDRGVMVETLETATTWSNLGGALRGGRRRAAAARCRRAAPRRS